MGVQCFDKLLGSEMVVQLHNKTKIEWGKHILRNGKDTFSCHDDVHIPDGIIPIREGGGLIQEGVDNIDINTEKFRQVRKVACAIRYLIKCIFTSTRDSSSIRFFERHTSRQ
jgi:hypothetical protein